MISQERLLKIRHEFLLLPTTVHDRNEKNFEVAEVPWRLSNVQVEACM